MNLMFIELLISAAFLLNGEAKKLLCGPNIFGLTKYDPETHVCHDNYTVIRKTESKSSSKGDNFKKNKSATHVNSTLILKGRHSETREPGNEKLQKYSTISSTEPKTLLCGPNIFSLTKYDPETHVCHDNYTVIRKTESNSSSKAHNFKIYKTATHVNSTLISKGRQSETREPGNEKLQKYSTISSTEPKTLLCGPNIFSLTKYDPETHVCHDNYKVIRKTESNSSSKEDNFKKYKTATHVNSTPILKGRHSETREPGNEKLQKHSTISNTESKTLLCGPNILSLTKYDPETHVCHDNYTVIRKTESKSSSKGDNFKKYKTATHVNSTLNSLLKGRHSETREPGNEKLQKHSTISSTESKTLLCGPNIFSLRKYDPETHVCHDNYTVIRKTESNSSSKGDNFKKYKTATHVNSTLILKGRHSETRVPGNEKLQKHSTISSTDSKTLLCGPNIFSLKKYDPATHVCHDNYTVIRKTESNSSSKADNFKKYKTATHVNSNLILKGRHSETHEPGNKKLQKHSTISSTELKTLLCGPNIFSLTKYNPETHVCHDNYTIIRKTESNSSSKEDSFKKYKTATHVNGTLILNDRHSETREPINEKLQKHSTISSTESKTLLCGNNYVKYDTKTHKCDNDIIVKIGSTIKPSTKVPVTNLQRTTSKEMLGNKSAGRRGFEILCSCCGVYVYPRRKSEAPCQHSSRNDAFLSGKLPKMQKKPPGAMICNEDIQFAYHVRITKKNSGEEEGYLTAMITKYKWQTYKSTSLSYFRRMKKTIGIKIPLDNYSPSRLRRKGFLILSNYQYLDDAIFFKAPKRKRDFLKKLEQIQAKCMRK